MKTPRTWLASVGAHVPPTMSAREAVDLGLYGEDSLAWYGWTGAAVAGEIPAPDLAVRAARQALDRLAGPSPELVLHLHAAAYAQGPLGWPAQHYILSQLGDHRAPSIAVWQSCNGAIAALELAAGRLTGAPGKAAVLITGSDNVGVPGFNRWSLGLQYGVIGDAGSALLLSTEPGFARLLAIGSASVAEAERAYRGSAPIFPPNSGSSDNVGADTGRAPATPAGLRARMADRDATGVEEGASLLARLSELRTETALRTLAEADLHPGDITRVVHNFTGHEQLLKSVLAPIGIDVGRGMLDYGRRVGHLTVNDQTVGLDHLVTGGHVRPGDHVMLLGFAGGVTTACAILRIEQTPHWRT
ncbi:ketoacyl-ACP synthase III family protein [Streptomyces sp. NPDC051546]|uniref:ketoacyl-ACP synthase III family protein n=1 Tax=Streptomyces sp. NPDC051546 TaxID=3365655 RepID=UPI0037938068